MLTLSVAQVDEIRTARRRTLQQQGNLMGVLARKSGDNFIITSDKVVGELPSKQAPKKPQLEVFQVWTGDGWSTSPDAATIFAELDAADDYIRANFDRIMK
jgi:hypothetical protein